MSLLVVSSLVYLVPVVGFKRFGFVLSPSCHTTFVSLVVFYLLNSFWAGLASAFGPFPKLHNRDLLPCQKTGSGQRLEFVMLVAANTA